MWTRRTIQHLDDLSEPVVATAIVSASVVSIIALAFALLA
jgi:hypothetical protein